MVKDKEPTKEQTLKELEEELRKKKLQLESPFSAVGNAAKPVRRGRPASITTTEESSDPDVALSQRMNGIKRPPENTSVDGIRDWAETEIHKLLPEAVASLAWDIKYGNEKVRAEARTEILRATGIDKKDLGNFAKGGQIVIQVNGGIGGEPTINLPYLKRAEQPKANSEPANPIIQTLEAESSSGKKKE